MSGLQNAQNPDRADFDWRGFALALRRRQRDEGRALAPIADEIGVTVADLSRAMGGQMVSVAKVMAMCDWLGVGERTFYLAPEKVPAKSTSFSGSNVEPPQPPQPPQPVERWP